jgi:hypothetical protein
MGGGSKMLTLPLEIWDKIFVDACVDGGFTGGSLALVSHHIHQMSARRRLQSVSVTGSTQLRGLLYLLRRTPDKDHQVRFLYASDATAVSSNLREPGQKALQEWHMMYSELITLIAPYIEVLTLHTTVWHMLLGVQLPRLRDLSVPGFSLPYDGSTLLLPSLRRLHIFNMLHRSKHLLAIAQMDELEELRLSDVMLMTDLPDVLGTFLGIATYKQRLQEAYDRDQSSHSRKPIDPAGIRTFKHLHKLIIQLGRLTPEPYGTDTHINSRMISDLSSLGRQYGGGRTNIFILPAREGGYGAAEAKKDWRGTVESGGVGAWVGGAAQASWDEDNLTATTNPIVSDG